MTKHLKSIRPGNKILRPSIFVILFVLFIAAGTSAQQGFNVVDVKVEGNHIAKESLILSVAAINKGDFLTASKTQEAVTRLYQLGFFKDVQLLADEAQGGLILTIKVKELPRLEQLKFRGNETLSDEKLTEELNMSQSNYLSPNLIFEKKTTIKELYGEKGYFYVEVEHDLNYTPDSTSADLVFKIKEGPRLKVENVILTGVTQMNPEKIIKQMRNRKRGLFLSSSFDKDKYPEDKEKIIEYMHQNGHIDAYLKSDSLAIDTSTNRMTIYLDVYEGPRYYFGETDFTGNEVIPDRVLSHALKYDIGDVYDIEEFEESLYELYFVYQEKGHLHVRIIDDRNTQDSVINLTFDIIEGLPSEINLVKIVGNTKTRERVIRREMDVRPGQVFHRSLLIRSIRDIMALNYFANVTPDIINLPSGDVDVLVEVEEKPTAQISAGAGYSGRDKFVGTFGVGIPNFRGMGQNLSVNVDIGSKYNSYSLSFTEPWAFSTPTSVGGDLYYTNREWEADYTEGRRGGSVRLGRRLRWPDNYFRIYARYRIEDDRFYDFSENYRLRHSYQTTDYYRYETVNDTGLVDTVVQISNNIKQPLPNSLERFGGEWFSSSSLQLSLIRDSRNLPEFATKGSIFSYTFETTGGLLGGYWEYQTHRLAYTKFIPIIGKMALAAKVSYGLVTSTRGDDYILDFERFSVGGTGYDGIVRGYEDGSLTPDSIVTIADTTFYYSVAPDEASDPDSMTVDTLQYQTRVRGKHMLVGNFELQLPLIENQLYALGFFDIGNSWLNRENVKINDLYKGVGIGFRLMVPGVGTIGFDFGYPLDKRYEGIGKDRKAIQDWKIHFQIGTTFR